jgi:hypothetical protein
VIIRVVLQNLKDGGGQRWPLLAERINAAEPDLVLLNEADGWTDHGMLAHAAHGLGLKTLPLPPSDSGYHVALLYRPTLGDPFEVCADFSGIVTHGVLVAGWQLPGLAEPLAVCVTHASPFDPIDTLRDTHKAAWTAARYGDNAVIGGAFNMHPLVGPPPDFTRMSLRDKALRYHDPRADPPRHPRTEVPKPCTTAGSATPSPCTASELVAWWLICGYDF